MHIHCNEIAGLASEGSTSRRSTELVKQSFPDPFGENDYQWLVSMSILGKKTAKTSLTVTEMHVSEMK